MMQTTEITKTKKISNRVSVFAKKKLKTPSETVSSKKPTLEVVITAAGSSTRMGGKIKKEYLPLESGTVLSTSLKKFLTTVDAQFYVITTPADGIDDAKKAIECDSEVNAILKKNPDIKIDFVEGGKTRQESVLNALERIEVTLPKASAEENNFFVAIHDAARPFVTSDVITRTLKAAIGTGAAFPGIEPTDTQKQIDENGKVISHLKRSDLISVQTPQIFEFQKLYNAHKLAANNGYPYTDDAEIWGRYCGEVIGVKGDAGNIKITYPEDYREQPQHLSEEGTPLYRNGNKCSVGKTASREENSKMTKIGLGYDLHKLVPNRKLIIGGVEIPFDKGEDGHSDGDVLLHAITDALLGATGLGDIGSFFPPEDDKWKDADSKRLLKTVWDKIRTEGWELENIDCVVKLEKPKFLPYREQVIKSIANVLEVPSEKIFVKAKTYEQTGNWENQIEAFANCLLSKSH